MRVACVGHVLGERVSTDSLWVVWCGAVSFYSLGRDPFPVNL